MGHGVAIRRSAQIPSDVWCSGEIGSRAAARTRDVANLPTTPLVPDDLLGTLNPVWSTTEPAGRVVEVRRETADTSTLLIRTGPRRPQHRAGQYVGVGARLAASGTGARTR